MSALNNAFLELYLSKKKNSKALMKIKPTEEINKAYIESVNPSLMQLKGRFGNCTFLRGKLKLALPSPTNTLKETKKLSELFSFLPENIET